MNRWWVPALLVPLGIVILIVVMYFGSSFLSTSAVVAPPPPAATVTTPATPAPADLCNDIPGVQTANDIVAAGLVRNASGGCKPPEVAAPSTTTVEVKNQPEGNPITWLESQAPKSGALHDFAVQTGLPDWLVLLGAMVLAVAIVILVFGLFGALLRAPVRLPPPVVTTTPPATPAPTVTTTSTTRVTTWGGVHPVVAALAAIAFIVLLQYFGGIGPLTATPIQLWLLLALVIAVVVAGIWGIRTAVAGVLTALAILAILNPQVVLPYLTANFGISSTVPVVPVYGTRVQVVPPPIGAECDNIPHTVSVGTTYQPLNAHVGCTVVWWIKEDSPVPCITLVGTNGRDLAPQACRGHEEIFAGTIITGWKTAGGVAKLDVIFDP